MATPRLEIDLARIHRNATCLVERLASRGITLTGVTKVVLGSPEVARTLLAAGVHSIGDSRIENIEKMRQAGIVATFILLRTPLLSQVDQVVAHADISFNSELELIERLSETAQKQGKSHRIVLMVELGDLREGLAPEDLAATVRRAIDLPNIEVSGIGTNLACFGGIKPDHEKMNQLSDLAQSVEEQLGIRLALVSGGNSANFDWLGRCQDPGKINHLRLGESIFLGCETLRREPIDGLHTDAFTLVAEVIESKVKSSVPSGEVGQDAFGTKRHFHDRGPINHALLGIGRQDVLVSGLVPLKNELLILGSSSDHLVVESRRGRLKIGEELRFRLDYGALLAAMTSPYVRKVFLQPSA